MRNGPFFGLLFAVFLAVFFLGNFCGQMFLRDALIKEGVIRRGDEIYIVTKATRALLLNQ